MNRTKTTILLAAVAAIVAGCGSDDVPGLGDNPQPEVPGAAAGAAVTVNVGVGDMKTRAGHSSSELPDEFILNFDATTEGGNKYDNVTMTRDDATGQYNPSVTMTWGTENRTATVRAWTVPVDADDEGYTMTGTSQTVSVAADQTDEKNIRQSDFLCASTVLDGEGNKSITIEEDALNITFQHVFSKIDIRCHLGTELTSRYPNARVSKVEIGGVYRGGSFNFDDGAFIETDNDNLTGQGTVTAYLNAADAETGDVTAEAIMIPQYFTTADERPTLTVTLINGSDEKTLPEVAINTGSFLVGKRYTMTVNIGSEVITVSDITAQQWTDSGNSETVTGKTVLVKYTAADVKKGDYIYADGTTSDGGLRTVYTDGSMVSLSGAEKPQPVAGKTVVGIVFWTPSETSTGGRTTPASLTDDKIMAADYPNCTHGLAVSLKDVSTGMAWQSSSESVATYFQSSYFFTHPNKNNFVSIASGTWATNNINKILGYQNTQVLLYYNVHCNGNSKPNYIANPVAALAAFGQNTNPAPAGSTGWFFPSAKELHILCYKDVDNVYWGNGTDTRDIVNTSLSAASGDNLTDSKYWSSSEYADDSNCAFSIQFYKASVEAYGQSKSYQYKVRAVCAF